MKGTGWRRGGSPGPFGRAILCAVGLILAGPPAQALETPGYYAQAGGALFRLPQGRPEEVALSVPEWQVRLYRRGAILAGTDHWGLITGTSAEDVLTQLAGAQAFEHVFEIWCGCGPQTYTYLNPLGPIAVFDSARAAPQHVIEALRALKPRLARLREDQRRFELIFFNKPEGHSIYRVFERALLDYGNALRHALKDVAELERRVADSPGGDDLAALLKDATAELARTEDLSESLDADVRRKGDWTRASVAFRTRSPVVVYGYDAKTRGYSPDQSPVIEYTLTTDVGVERHRLAVKVRHRVREGESVSEPALEMTVRLRDLSPVVTVSAMSILFGDPDNPVLWEVSLRSPRGAIEYRGVPPAPVGDASSLLAYEPERFRLVYDQEALATEAARQLRALISSTAQDVDPRAAPPADPPTPVEVLSPEPLNRAIASASLTDVDLLLKANPALVYARDSQGRTALHVAAARADESITERLVAGGGDVNARDNGGETPLFSAARSGSAKVLRLLLERGADVDLRDAKGTTALDEALRQGRRGQVDLLRAFQLTSLMARGSSLDVPGLKGALEMGIDVNQRDSNGLTLLHHVAGKLKWDTVAESKRGVAFLVSRGADINALDRDGGSALSALIASHDGPCERWVDLLRFFIGQGADLQAGNTPVTLDDLLRRGGKRCRSLESLVRRHLPADRT